MWDLSVGLGIWNRVRWRAFGPGAREVTQETKSCVVLEIKEEKEEKQDSTGSILSIEYEKPQCQYHYSCQWQHQCTNIKPNIRISINLNVSLNANINVNINSNANQPISDHFLVIITHNGPKTMAPQLGVQSHNSLDAKV
jgi:hypothetical protein